jgi:hypothetical protein
MQRFVCPFEYLGACLKIVSDAAAGDFGFWRGGAGGASPQRAVTPVTTKPKVKGHAAQRVFALQNHLAIAFRRGKLCFPPPEPRFMINFFTQKQHYSEFSDRL